MDALSSPKCRLAAKLMSWWLRKDSSHRNWIVTKQACRIDTTACRLATLEKRSDSTFRFPHEVAFQVLCEDTGKPAPKVLVTGGGGDGTTNAEGRTML